MLSWQLDRLSVTLSNVPYLLSGHPSSLLLLLLGALLLLLVVRRALPAAAAVLLRLGFIGILYRVH